MIIYYVYIKYIFYALLGIGVPIGLLLILKIIQKATLGKCKSLTCLNGKTVLITGCTSGIGYETALNLASRGCRLILANKEGGHKIKRQIVKHTNNNDVVVKTVDFASLTSVRKFVKEIYKTEKRLDILINNVDKWISTNKHTDDGLHEIMQLNHFGPFLLTYLLIDLLKKSSPSRIIFVSSAASYFSNLSIENLNYPKGHPLSWFRTSLIYGNSKLCSIIAASVFAIKLEEFGITCNSLHPGFLDGDHFEKNEKTTFWDKMETFFTNPIGYLYGKTPSEGAQTILHLALSKKLEDVTGKYFVDCISFPLPFGARNKKFCNDVFEESELMVRLKKSEILSDNKEICKSLIKEVCDEKLPIKEEATKTETLLNGLKEDETSTNKNEESKEIYFKNNNTMERAFNELDDNKNLKKGFVLEKNI